VRPQKLIYRFARMAGRPTSSRTFIMLAASFRRMTDAEHEAVRGRYFANEAFLIGMLQAVSGGSVVAVLAQFDVLLGLMPRWVLIVCTTISRFSCSTWKAFGPQ
jgi:hypothetical protein